MKEATPAAIVALGNGDIDNFITASTPGGIEAQEAAGQKDFVASQTLPKDCPRQELETLGFIFGEDEDDIFVNVQFPEGWSKKATEHSMHNDLIDNKGRIRGGIFYKAAFYDRRANLRLNRRFSFQQDYEEKRCVQYNIMDADTIVFKTPAIKCEEYSDEYWKAVDKSEKKATKFLDDHYSDWKNESAYWEE